MAKGQVNTSLLKKNQSTPSNSKKQGSSKSIMIHVFLVFLMVLQWAGIILDLPKEYNYVMKPSVVLTMFFYTLLQNHNGAKAFKQFMVIGFLFSALGDIFLMFEGLQFFLYGLISFATAHIAFLVGFFENSSFDSNQFVNFSAPLGVSLVGYGYYMFNYLTNQQGFPENMKTPVLVYIVLISTMAFAASMRDKTSQKSYYIAFVGAIFFVCSDSTLSFNLFVPGFGSKLVKFIIMFTYYIAEHLIFIASLLHYNYFKTSQHEKKD